MAENAPRKRKPFPWHIVVFLVPATLVYTAFMVLPLVDSMRMSFFTSAPGEADSFVGLQNYVTLLTDELWSPHFWNALKNNFVFFAVHFFVQNPIGLLLAALLTQATVRGKGFFRTVYFLPTMLSFVIVGFVWQLILSPLWGIPTRSAGSRGARIALPSVGSGWKARRWSRSRSSPFGNSLAFLCCSSTPPSSPSPRN